MSQSAFPQSVRKRRKRIMYHYIIVCILCWIPTIIFYFVELIGFHVPALEIVGRTSLYLSGFLNFLVFGMQDPHLKRSFILVLHYMGLSLIIPRAAYYRGPLKTNDVEKVVMFEEATISRNADFSKDKKNIYRYHKLSKDDKKSLYADRPDLDPKSAMTNSVRVLVASGDLSKDSMSAPLLNKGARPKHAKVDDNNEDGSGEDSSRHSIVVLGDLLSEGDVQSPLHSDYKGASSSSSSSNKRLEEGLNVSSSAVGGPSTDDTSSNIAFGSRHSTELLLTSDDRNSLGLNLLHPPAVNNSEKTAAESLPSVVETADNRCPYQEEPLIGGFADASDDESSDDDSDEEDEALNAPV